MQHFLTVKNLPVITQPSYSKKSESQGDTFRNQTGHQLECDGQTLEGSKRRRCFWQDRWSKQGHTLKVNWLSVANVLPSQCIITIPGTFWLPLVCYTEHMIKQSERHCGLRREAPDYSRLRRRFELNTGYREVTALWWNCEEWDWHLCLLMSA
jgi:hypothetical protein